MSRQSGPITTALFADAIKELPLSVVYTKAAELQNSISHLQRSNSELQNFVAESHESEEEKREIAEYIVENEHVIASMTERIRLLRAEVQARGQLWLGTEHGTAESEHGLNGEERNGTATGESRERGADGGDEGVYL